MDTTKYISKVSGHAVVFGGSGGIGYEVVMALAANGASAISFTYGRNQEKADELITELKALGISAYAKQINLSDEADVKTFLEEAVTTVGSEILTAVNAVGVSPNKHLRKQTLDNTSSDKDDMGWRNVFEVNVFGCMVSMRAVANRMEEKGVHGSIVIITSTNGVNSQSSISTHYDSAKAAQIMLMKGLSEEYAPSHIRINSVAPGWVDTEMNKTLPESERKKEMSRIWTGRFAEPYEIANFIVFLCGTGGSYAYGQNYMVDGGYR